MSSLEEEVYYGREFWGEQPEIPQMFPPTLFGCEPQWSAVEEEIILTPPFNRPQFLTDLEEGAI